MSTCTRPGTVGNRHKYSCIRLCDNYLVLNCCTGTYMINCSIRSNIISGHICRHICRHICHDICHLILLIINTLVQNSITQTIQVHLWIFLNMKRNLDSEFGFWHKFERSTLRPLILVYIKNMDHCWNFFRRRYSFWKSTDLRWTWQKYNLSHMWSSQMRY